MNYNPKPGMTIDELDTPALLVDLDALEFNIRTMADFFAGKSVALRPHIKTHKCLQIAQKQIAAGAIGVTCAKVSEAAAMARSGVTDILIANQVIGATKLERLTDLARQCNVIVAVDQPDNVRDLSAACRAKSVNLRVLIEVEIGMGRCGAMPGEPVLELARQIADAPNLEFAGLQAYEGHLVLIADPDERVHKVREAFAPLQTTGEMLTRAGLAPRIVSGGATGTYDITSECPPLTEIQAGSYVFMDCTYLQVRPEFKPALSVLSTVLSRSTPRGLVTDAGLKAMTKDFGFPQLVDVAGATMRYLSEEHAVLDLANPDLVHLRPGDKVRFIPNHCCTTTNLHNQLYVVQRGVLVDIWDVAARGCVQ